MNARGTSTIRMLYACVPTVIRQHIYLYIYIYMTPAYHIHYTATPTFFIYTRPTALHTHTITFFIRTFPEKFDVL